MFGFIDIYNINIFYEKIALLTLELDTLKTLLYPVIIDPPVILTPIAFDKLRTMFCDPADTKSPTKGI